MKSFTIKEIYETHDIEIITYQMTEEKLKLALLCAIKATSLFKKNYCKIAEHILEEFGVAFGDKWCCFVVSNGKGSFEFGNFIWMNNEYVLMNRHRKAIILFKCA